jgi:outer membrane protein assembly factor BamB
VTTDLPSGGESSPVIANGRVYVHVHQREAKLDTIACLDEATGATQWRRDFDVVRRTIHDGSATPCVTKGRCLVMGARFCYCLDAATGAVLWATKAGDDLNPVTQEVSSSVAVVNDVAVVVIGPMFGFDLATGATLWQGPNPRGYASAMTSAVACSGGGVIYGGQDQLCCLEAGTGRVVWNLPGGGRRLYAYAPTAVVSKNTLVALSKEELRGFDLTSGPPRQLWHIPYGDPYSTPAADADHCYMIDPGFTFTDGRGHSNGSGGHYAVVCRDLQTGGIEWKTPIPDSQYSSPILVNGKLFVLADGARELKMLDARDGRVLGSASVGAVNWSSPAVAQGKLFVRVNHGVACYDLSASAAEISRSTTEP